MRKALVERHPRDSFQLVTKLPLRDFKDAEDLERIFKEQLAHCGVEYFDYYLLHNMGTNVYEKCRKYDAFGFVARKKAEGKIRQVGMLSRRAASTTAMGTLDTPAITTMKL